MIPDTAASKVTAAHLSRRALLYIRQSSLKQVIHNTKSAIRQYDLRGKAIALGWAADQITVIDIDQGQSGSSAIPARPNLTYDTPAAVAPPAMPPSAANSPRAMLTGAALPTAATISSTTDRSARPSDPRLGSLTSIK